MRRSTLGLLADAWRLGLPYFARSPERWSARLLLGGIIALGLINVGITVVLNFWYGAFYDVLQNRDLQGFFALQLWYRWDSSGFMIGFVPLVSVYVPLAVLRLYLEQYLQIRWRRWMTNETLGHWVADRAYYTLSLTRGVGDRGTDNPDQRISEDIRDFTSNTVTLGVQFINRVVSIINFSIILWGLSGSIELFGITIPGYMLWGAVLYAVIGSWLTNLVGRPLIPLNFAQQKAEADFRFALVRLRENAEGVALSAGEAEETTLLTGRFHEVALNWFRIMHRNLKLNLLTLTYAQAAVIFPFLLGAPAYFAGRIALGGLMRVVSAFGQVQDSLSWFINVYQDLASWSAVVDRLTTFRAAIDAARAREGSGPILVPGDEGISLRGAKIALPDGAPIVEEPDFVLKPGQSLTLSGNSGAGKSTIFRAIAGIWPFGGGKIERAPGTYLFLPQRPYIPLGTLRHAVSYPGNPELYPAEDVRRALSAAGLEALSQRIDEEQNWALVLSGGEQQRLSVARALLLRPDWLFLDEATSNLDPGAEAQLYAAIQRELPETTVVSIAHRPELARWHEAVAHLERAPGSAGRIERRQAAATIASTAAP